MEALQRRSVTYLMSLCARLLTQRSIEALAVHGVAPAYLPVIGALNSMGETSQRELADHVAIEPPTMARTLARMERDGLVVRTADPADHRRVIVRLSARAEELVPRLGTIAAVLTREATAGLPGVSQDEFVGLLARVAENLEDRGAITRAIDAELARHE